eukprot:TRINITY_DN7787_c0_g1_i1.p1 TRINITY_DN7787_c0_g1~~TRINITY_DN7787_c0_g1_i1.p1  ORF type:complete len:192 (+),score=30.61 TRINITY_DN7787_c0_g1_i1:176-751(+)
MSAWNTASEILPGFLYLGGRSALKDALAKNVDIAYVLNVTEYPNRDDPKITQLFIEASDISSQNLSDRFQDAHDFILKAKEEKKAIFVHCEVGMSRSSTIVLSYLISHEGMSLKDAYHHTKKARPIISPNTGFLEQLIEHEKKVHGKSTLSLGGWGRLNWTVDEVPNTNSEESKTVDAVVVNITHSPEESK